MSNQPKVDAATGEVDDKRPYYCPGCGARFETPGVCTGAEEGTHEEIAVEKVKADSGSKHGLGEKPSSPKRKRPASSSSSSRKKVSK